VRPMVLAIDLGVRELYLDFVHECSLDSFVLPSHGFTSLCNLVMLLILLLLLLLYMLSSLMIKIIQLLLL
jgi:hypothetical protein